MAYLGYIRRKEPILIPEWFAVTEGREHVIRPAREGIFDGATRTFGPPVLEIIAIVEPDGRALGGARPSDDEEGVIAVFGRGAPTPRQREILEQIASDLGAAIEWVA